MSDTAPEVQMFTRDPHTDETRALDLVQAGLVIETLTHHDIDFRDTITHRIAKVCIDCGSIAEAPSEYDRNNIVANFDLTCCSEVDTVYFSSGPADIDPIRTTDADLEEIQ